LLLTAHDAPVNQSPGATTMIAPTNWARRAAALAVALSFALPAAASAATSTPVLDSEEKALCSQVNTYRAQNGRAPLKLSVSLTKSAKWLSADMAAKDYFDHTDSLGRNFSQRITAFGYRGAMRSENIAASTATAAATLEQWKRSAPHRKNLLGRGSKVIGIGRAYNAGSLLGWYWTTTFGGTADRAVSC
jgi:uncharacterized protein YkwD